MSEEAIIAERICVILNPAAGKTDLRELERALPSSVEIRTTKGPGEARQLAARARDERFDLVVAAGGDGTLNEVINGLLPDPGEVVCGLLPLGTGNDFARSVGVPTDLGAGRSRLGGGAAVRCGRRRTDDHSG